MKQNKTILKENLVESTIHIINRLVRMATNQSKKDKCETDYYCMTGNLVEEVINSYQNKSARTALVVDDIGTQVINRLYQEGLRQITLCLARFNNVKTETVDQVKRIITSAFPDIKLNIILIGELKKDMEFDLIIANPPYGKIGADITKKIIDVIDFDEYINLLPANDYKRNDTKDLFNYQSDMVNINDGFEDAAVTTHLARIHKTKVNDMTLDEFERSNYIDRSLDKYFAENSKRKHAQLDAAEIAGIGEDRRQKLDITKAVLFGYRDINHRHLAYSKTSTTYRWNVKRDIDNQFLYDNHKALRRGVYDGWVALGTIEFLDAIERDNFTNFIYSTNGFRFISKIFTAVNIDGSMNLGKLFPKVDWTRAWTVEEILADYGYTETEIQEVVNDLVNYKGMDE